LVISRRAAQHHVQHSHAKVGVSSRAALALYAHEHDFLSTGMDARAKPRLTTARKIGRPTDARRVLKDDPDTTSPNEPTPEDVSPRS